MELECLSVYQMVGSGNGDPLFYLGVGRLRGEAGCGHCPVPTLPAVPPSGPSLHSAHPPRLLEFAPVRTLPISMSL